MAKKLNAVTVSREGSGSQADLQTIHTVKNPITWSPLDPNVTLDLQIEDNLDDITHYNHSVTSTDGGVGVGSNSGIDGESAYRFTGVTIPAGSVINAAYITFTPLANDSDSVISNFYAHAHDASPRVTDESGWHSVVDSNLTNAVVPWNTSNWTQDVEENTPSIATIIQELINRPGFNDVVHIFWLDNGTVGANTFLSGRSHNNDPTKAAKLHIEYSQGIPAGWIKFNAYTLHEVERIRFTWPMGASATSFKIETSINNFEWEILSDTFAFDADETEVDVTYPTPVEFVWIRITVNGPVGFTIDDLEIYASVTVENTEIISHNFYTLYSAREREIDPFFPEITKNLLEQWEALPDMDLKLFDSTDFANSDITLTPVSGGTDITIVGSNIPVDSDVQYIWEFDDPNIVQITGDDGVIDITTDNFVLSTSVDMSDFSANEFAGAILEITSGVTNKREFVISAHTAADSSTGNTITVDSADPFTLSETDIDFQIKDVTTADALANPNIIVTTDTTTIQTHTYNKVGIYVPRLVFIHPKYMLEWTEFFERL